jgi:hypothetical protein
MAAPPSSRSVDPRLAATSGMMRDTVGGIHNLQHLLGSVKVGPKALARVIPFVHASCEPLIASAGELPRDAGARLGSAESFEDLSALVTKRMRELVRVLGETRKEALRASDRLHLEAAISATVKDLDGALELIELMVEATATGRVPVDVTDVIRESTVRQDTGSGRGRRVDLTFEEPGHPISVLVNPRLALRLVGFAAAIATGRDGGVHVRVSEADSSCRLSITAPAKAEKPLTLAVPPLIELSERCVTDIARAASAAVETTRGVREAVATFPMAAAE